MTLTRFQIHERLGSLSGEVKAAHEHKRLTAETLAHQEREVTLARQADEKAEAQIVRLEQEALDLAAAYHETVKELIGIGDGGSGGITPAADDGARNVDGTPYVAAVYGQGTTADFADFGHPTQNGLDQGVNEALDRARSV